MQQTASILPADADRVLISVNPKAGRRSVERRVDRLVALLSQRDFNVEVVTDLAEASAGANRLHAAGQLRALVGVGGDGTAAELVNRTSPGVPITLLAAGTANVLAKCLALAHTAEAVSETIVAGHLMQLDAGLASGRTFLLMAGCGFDADVVRRVHERREAGGRSGHISYFSYLKPIVESIRSYEYPAIRVYCDEPCDEPAEEASRPLMARWVFVCNLPRYGWGLKLAPSAEGADGLLDLCAFRKGSLLSGLRYVAAAQCGCHQRMADCVTRQARRFRITSDRPVAYQLDGDPGGLLPLDIEVLPGRLTVLVPASESSRR